MKHSHSSTWIGIIIVLLGLYFLGLNFNIALLPAFDFGDLISILWPLLLLSWGLEGLKKRNYIFGTLFTGLGLNFLLDNLTFVHPIFNRASEFVWPILIIMIGVSIIISPPKEKVKPRVIKETYGHNKPKYKDWDDDGYGIKPTAGQIETSQAIINRPAYKSSEPIDEVIQVEEKINDEPFISDVENNDETQKTKKLKRTRNYQTSFNQARIVLTEDDLIDGINQINITCSFGDFRMKLPKSVHIEIDGQVTLGDIRFNENKYDGIHDTFTASHKPSVPTEKTVLIKATCTFGDIRIKIV